MMKRCIIKMLLLCAVFVVEMSAQTTNPVPGNAQAVAPKCSVVTAKDDCVDSIERPQYPGGNKALLQWIQDSVVWKVVKHPSLEHEHASFRVVVAFKVDRRGVCKDFEMKRSIDPYIDKLILKEVKKIGPFIPATQKGKPIEASYNLSSG